MTKKLTKVAMTTALAAAAIVPAVVATPAQAAEAEVTFAKAYYSTANGAAAFEAGKLAGVISATTDTGITHLEASNGEVFTMQAFSAYLAVNPTATTDQVLTALSTAGKALSADQVKALDVKEGKVDGGKVTVDPTAVQKTALNEAIAKAEASPKAAELKDAIAAAKAVAENADATQAEVDAAVKALNEAIAEAEAVKELKVESVKAINNKEIKVIFNKEVTKASAEAVANYTISNISAGTFGAITPKLADDKKSVILTLGTAAGQQVTADVKVANVVDATGAKIADFTTKVAFLDTTLPTANSVKVTGPKSLEVEFSEPLQTAPTFVLNGGSYSVTPTFVAGTQKVTLTLGGTLPTGTHKLEVSGGTDYANFAIAKKELSFEYTADATAPTATVTKSTENQVTLKFDKKVQVKTAADVSVYHTLNEQTAYKATSFVADPTTVVNGYADTFVATFTTPIAPGAGKTLYLNTKANAFEDQWGNDVASATYSFDLVSDTTAPSVVKVEATGKGAAAQKEITVTFDEEVLKTDAENRANYILKDANGNIVKTADFAGVDANGKFTAATTIAYDNTKKTATITTATALPAGAYQLTVENVRDTSFNNNKLATQTSSFTVVDKILPTVGATTLVGTDVLYVDFSEAMNTEGLTTVGNYALGTTALPANTKVELVNNKRVKITLPAGHGLTGTHTVNVAGTLKDVAGNAIGGLYGTSTNSFTFGTPTTFTVSPVANQLKLVAANQLQFEVPTELSAADASKFTVTATGKTGVATISSVTYVNNNGKAVVTVTLNEDLASTDLTNVTSLVVNADGLTNSVGTKLSGTTTFATASSHVEDKLAPVINSVTTKTTTTIEVAFSEAINTSSVALGTFTVAGNTVTNISWAGNVLTLTLKDAIATDAKPAVTQALAVQDNAGNVLAAGTAVKATVDGIAASLTSAQLSTDKTKVTLTFSEAVSSKNDGTFGALTAANFTLAGTPAATVTAVEHLQTSANQVVLTVSNGAALTSASTIDALTTVYGLDKIAEDAGAQNVKGGITITGVAATGSQVTGGVAPTPETLGVYTVQVTDGTYATNDIITVDGTDLRFTTTPSSASAAATDIKALIEGNSTLAAKYSVSVTTDTITLTQKTSNGSITVPTVVNKTVAGAGTVGTVGTTSAGAAGSAGTKEVNKLVVTNGATAAGTVGVTFNDGTINKTIDVPVTTDDDTVAEVAAKIKAALEADTAINGAYDITLTLTTVANDTVTITAKTAAADKAVTITIANK